MMQTTQSGGGIWNYAISAMFALYSETKVVNELHN